MKKMCSKLFAMILIVTLTFNFGVINFNKDLYFAKSHSKFNGNSEKLLYVQSKIQRSVKKNMGASY